MKPADKLVEALLGDEDPKEFLDRQGDMAKSIIIDKLREQRVDPAIVNGVECFGMREDIEGNADRVGGVEDGPATFWTVTFHTTDPDNWMVDYDDFNTPEAARAAAAEARQILMAMYPDHEIHLVDDIV